MKLRYECQTYNSKGEPFTLVAKGTEIRVLQVDRKLVKIEWDAIGDSKYKTRFGYISHRQFIICVDTKLVDYKCIDCVKFGNCGAAGADKIACADFE